MGGDDGHLWEQARPHRSDDPYCQQKGCKQNVYVHIDSAAETHPTPNNQ
jgi:hypothetical protein